MSADAPAARVVFHVDMDAFFAAIEERDNPHLRGRPIVVGADPKGGRGRGVVSTANYEARTYGIRSAMPISEAWRRCPHAVFLPVDHARYASVSKRIATILYSIVEEAERGGKGGRRGKAEAKMVIEQASIDEFYIEARNLSWDEAAEFAESLKAEILKKEQLTCSVGVGPNPLIAKIASDFKKPDGLTIVRPNDVEAFLAPLPIRAIPGIGPKTEAVLRAQGVRTIGELRAMSREELVSMFGKWGEAIFERARGIDETPVGIEEEPKSIGEQETFAEDTRDELFLVERLMALCESVWERLERDHVRPRTVVLTVRFADFETKTRRRTMPAPVESLKELKQNALLLAMPFFDGRENPRRKAIRLLGIRGAQLSVIQ